MREDGGPFCERIVPERGLAPYHRSPNHVQAPVRGLVVEPQQAARGRVVDLRQRSRGGDAHAPNPERPASAAPIPAAPGLHDRWKKRPLSLSRTRGRPVPAEMLPALSPQASQQRAALYYVLTVSPASSRSFSVAMSASICLRIARPTSGSARLKKPPTSASKFCVKRVLPPSVGSKR